MNYNNKHQTNNGNNEAVEGWQPLTRPLGGATF